MKLDADAYRGGNCNVENTKRIAGNSLFFNGLTNTFKTDEEMKKVRFRTLEKLIWKLRGFILKSAPYANVRQHK